MTTMIKETLTYIAAIIFWGLITTFLIIMIPIFWIKELIQDLIKIKNENK